MGNLGHDVGGGRGDAEQVGTLSESDMFAPKMFPWPKHVAIYGATRERLKCRGPDKPPCLGSENYGNMQLALNQL
jgi:hypothetical protein